MRPIKLDSPLGDDLWRARLSQQIDLRHPLVRLAGLIDWATFEARFGKLYHPQLGRPGVPIRLMVGLCYLQHTFCLSDQEVVARWVENPYWQHFCGFDYLQLKLPIDPSSLVRWRRRIGQDGIELLLQATIAAATQAEAVKSQSLERVSVDTTVQPKNVAFPTDVRLMHKALGMLVRLARKHGVRLRQSYVRVAKRAAIMAGRYAHAKQFKRFNREVRFLRTRLGRVIRDIRRKTAGDAELEAVFAVPLSRADQVRRQRQRQRGWKLYSLHAPEVECIGKGKARAPYEFGCKVSLATPVTRPKGGQFVLHAQALHGNPHDGHTLGPVVAAMEQLTGVEVDRIHVDKGYRGHSYENKFRVWISGQVRRVTKTIRREMKRRAAIEPVIGHIKAEHRMDRNYLSGRDGDRANAVLAAAGYNFRLLLRWLEALLRVLFAAILAARSKPQAA
jgi:transposase, IS5 family